MWSGTAASLSFVSTGITVVLDGRLDTLPPSHLAYKAVVPGLPLPAATFQVGPGSGRCWGVWIRGAG